MTIIIETPAPPTRERLVLVPLDTVSREAGAELLTIRTANARDATPDDLARAGLVLREQAAPGTCAASASTTTRPLRPKLEAEGPRPGDKGWSHLAHLRADLRDMTARAEGAERLREECESVLTAMGARAREAEEFARVLEVERDALLAELADAKAERDRAIRDCAATAAERNEARAELARLTAPVEGEPSYEALREALGEFPGGGLEFALSQWRAGVAHERARQQPAQDRATDEELFAIADAVYEEAHGGEVLNGLHEIARRVAAHVRRERCSPDEQPAQDRATDEELERAFYAAYDPLVTNGRGAIEGRSAGLLAVAARVRQERCLVARAVAANVDVRLADGRPLDATAAEMVKLRAVAEAARKVRDKFGDDYEVRFSPLDAALAALEAP